MLIARLLLLPFVLGVSSVSAQQPGRIPTPAPTPVFPPPAGLPLPPLPNSARLAVSSPEALVRVQFPNAQLSEIMNYYQDWTGKRVLLDANALTATMSVNVSDMVTKAEAIKIIETQLTLNGFLLVAAGDDMIKVLGLGKQVKSASVPLYSDLSQVPDGEQSISFLLRLRYLDPNEVAQQLQQYILGGTNNGFASLPKSGAIIITETANNIRKIIVLISQLDVPAAPVVEKFIRLERADATKAVEFLNGVFDTKSAGGATGQNGVPGIPGQPNLNPNIPNRRAIRRINEEGQPVFEPVGALNPALGANLIALSGDSIIQGRINLTADVRTNRIHVVTNPVNMPLVEKLIADYDANTPFASPVRRPLKFVNAHDVLPILIQALAEPGSDNNGANAGAAGGNTSRPPPTAQNNGGNNLFGNGGSNSGSGSGTGSSFGSEDLNTQPVDTTPTEATVGTTKIIADPRSNTIILLGSAEARDKVFKVLDQLDVRAPQVVIRVVIGELSIGKNSELGLNYLLNRSRGALTTQFNPASFSSTLTTNSNSGLTTGAASPAPSFSTSSSVLDNLAALGAGVPSGFTGLAGIISVTKGFDVILSALEATNRFKTVNRPVLFTSNNKKAVIISGQEIAVPTQSQSSITGTNTGGVVSNVEFKTVALQLEVVPLINSDREVTLDIVQKLDSVVAGSSVAVGGNSIPTIAKRELKSTVSMPNGATVVLGGLITLSDDKTEGAVPYLSKIPVLGELFKTRSRNLSRSELIILIHPEVTNTPAEIAEQRAEEDRHNYLESNLDEQVVPLIPRAKPVIRTTTTTRKTVVTTK